MLSVHEAFFQVVDAPSVVGGWAIAIAGVAGVAVGAWKVVTFFVHLADKLELISLNVNGKLDKRLDVQDATLEGVRRDISTLSGQMGELNRRQSELSRFVASNINPMNPGGPL